MTVHGVWRSHLKLFLGLTTDFRLGPVGDIVVVIMRVRIQILVGCNTTKPLKIRKNGKIHVFTFLSVNTGCFELKIGVCT